MQLYLSRRRRRVRRPSIGRPEARDATIELGGPEAVSQLEAVRIFEEVGGRPFDVQYVPEETLRAQIESADDPKQKTFAAFMLALAHDDEIDMSQTLRTLPIRLTSVREYAERMLVG